jgi:hypothetical protein
MWIGWSKGTRSANTCEQHRGAVVPSFLAFVALMTEQAGEVLRRCVPAMLGFTGVKLEA